MYKTITAEFESVDLAEMAARNIREKFEGITKIKIRYPSIGEGGGYISLPVASINNPMGAGFPRGNDGILYDLEQRHEVEQNRSSILLVEATEDSAERIAAYLRGLGGLGIKIKKEE